MNRRPATVTVISWFVMMASAVVVTMFVLRVASLNSYEITSLSALVWWFVLGLFPLYFVSGLFMLRGKDWARQLCVGAGASCIFFGVVVLPFTVVTAAQILFLVITTVLLYRPQANLFFMHAKVAQRRLSLTSFLVGVFAVFLTATATYVRSMQIPGRSVSLDWLTKIGLVEQSRTGESSLTEASIFAINDENALVFLMSSAVLLAAVAMVIALIAEYRREPTLYLSAGYTCGVLALVLFKPLIGFVAIAVGFAAVAVLRQDRRSDDERG
jgi:hypothetical protein